MALQKLVDLLETKTKKEPTGYEDTEKREFVRLRYPVEDRPKLKIAEHELQVVDISEEGIKVFNEQRIDLEKKVSGTVIFNSGKSIDVSGTVVWSRNNEFGMLITRIGQTIIVEEIKALIKKMGIDESEVEA